MAVPVGRRNLERGIRATRRPTLEEEILRHLWGAVGAVLLVALIVAQHWVIGLVR